ncbi:acyl-CoA-binding domain-containing protein 6-like [Leptopilina boulardi]|uniref:acyl-CoA-binding domain-containing protein 6-like n=1 Tax=Leptopilina boulardi TaxID=63433 RepID=UPI0021F5E076|nr:acyl-CoA-binding domain-containing protein 6-like [Leptopilina boulardi]
MAEGDIFKSSDLEETFDKAARHLQSLVSQLDSGQLLGFYGLYKQATCGSCDTPKPSWYQMQAKHKWEAWQSLGEMSREVAMASYIRAVGKIDPDWEEKSNDNSQAWVAVSRLPNTDEELRDIDKTFFDWVKDGNEVKVAEILSQNSKCILQDDENGMYPLHWAADRGHVPTIKCLVEAGADINVKDQDGQTPLHYVASCGHIEACKYLLSKGAENLQDNDGLTPKEIADEHTLPMF